MAHWIEDENTRKRFWKFAKNKSGLTEDETHEALKAESVKDYKGTMEQAKAAIEKFATDKDAQIAAEREAQRAQRAQERAATDALLQDVVASFPSLPIWASTVAVDPSGFPWKVSIAAGLTPDLRMAAVEQVQDGVAEFTEWAACHGWHPANGNGNGYRAQPTRPAQPKGVTQLPSVVTSARPAQPQAPGGGPPEPPAPPPPPTSAGAPPAPPAAADSNGGSETFAVESIVPQVSPNGNRYYAIKGGRCKKHGVTAWPEVAEPQLVTLTQYDVSQLEVGKEWDVAGFHIQAVAEVPPGKEYPNKVTAFAPSP